MIDIAEQRKQASVFAIEVCAGFGVAIFCYGLHLIYSPLVFLFLGFVICGIAANFMEQFKGK